MEIHKSLKRGWLETVEGLMFRNYLGRERHSCLMPHLNLGYLVMNRRMLIQDLQKKVAAIHSSLLRVAMELVVVHHNYFQWLEMSFRH